MEVQNLVRINAFYSCTCIQSIDFVFKTTSILEQKFLPCDGSTRLVETNVFYCFTGISSIDFVFRTSFIIGQKFLPYNETIKFSQDKRVLLL